MQIQHPIYWFDIRGAHDRRWDFFLSTPAITAELWSGNKKEDIYGVTIPSEARVYINALIPEESIWETTLHELMHVALDVANLGLKEEERFVMAATPGLASFLAQLNLEMPALPYGFQAMRKQKRRRK